MRKFDDLSERDKGAYIVRKEIKIRHADLSKKWPPNHYLSGIEDCVKICNQCLDIATLGEIE